MIDPEFKGDSLEGFGVDLDTSSIPDDVDEEGFDISPSSENDDW